jgi:hypothetical protein
MKTFKIIDAWVSLISLLVFVVIVPFYGIEMLITGYLVVGTWQVISMIAHATSNASVAKHTARVIYHWITLVSLLTIPIGSFWILLFIAPFMAIYYTGLCFWEIKHRMARPISVIR